MSRPYAQVLKRFGQQRDGDVGADAISAEVADEPLSGSDAGKAFVTGESVAVAPVDSLANVSLLERSAVAESDLDETMGDVGETISSAAESLLSPPGPAQAQMTRSGLLDTLRMVSPRREAPCVVVAGASGVEAVRQLTVGLLRQARATGVSLLLAEADSGVAAPSLRVVDNSSHHARPEFVRGTTIEWDDADMANLPRAHRLDPWLASASTHHDLVVIEGPSLDRSLEAALLGARCDGMVILAEVGRTHRDKLAVAAERVVASGCAVHGLVLDGTRRWLPRWLDRILEEMAS